MRNSGWGSVLLDQGKTPEEWVQVFASRGIKLSARTIRAEARRLGACRMLGNAMILLPEHIDRIFTEPAPRASKPSSPPLPSLSRDRRSSPPAAEGDRLYEEHLERKYSRASESAEDYLRRRQQVGKRKPRRPPPKKGS